MEFEFQRQRIDKVSRQKIIEELNKVAKHFGFREFTCREFDSASDVSHQVILREFGNWKDAITFLKEQLNEKCISLDQRTKPRRKDSISSKELFNEMERIWKIVGHRPSKAEWDSLRPTISYNTIRRHFNGWTNACLKFIEYKMGNALIPEKRKVESAPKNVVTVMKDSRLRRDIPLKLRLKVLERDNFRCVFCGRSPATDLCVKLHIDHIEPFSNGGKTTLTNLQTLCFDCNLGKGKELLLS